MFEPRESLLTLGMPPPKGQILVNQSPYTNDTVNAIREMLEDRVSIIPMPSPDCAESTNTVKIRRNKVVDLRAMFKMSTYGCFNIVTQAYNIFDNKLKASSPMDDYLIFNRGEVVIISAAFNWCVSSTKSTSENLAVANIVTKSVLHRMQAIPSEEETKLSIDLYDKTVALTSAKMVDQIGVEIGEDANYLYRYGWLKEVISPLQLSESLKATITENSTALGIAGENSSPLMITSGTEILNKGDEISTNATKPEEAYWDELEDSIGDVLSPVTLNTPIGEQPDLMAELCRSDWVEEMKEIKIKGTLNDDATATETTFITRQRVLTKCTAHDVIKVLEPTQSIIELPWGATVESTDKSVTVLLKSAKAEHLCVDLSTTDFSTHGSKLGLSLEQTDTIRYRLILKPSRTYTAAEATLIGNALKKVWNALLKVKLDDVDQALNAISIGAAALGNIFGSPALMRTSDIIHMIKNGFGQLQVSAKTISGKTATDVQGLYNGMIAKGVLGAAMEAFKIGKKIIQDGTKGKSDLKSKVQKLVIDGRKAAKDVEGKIVVPSTPTTYEAVRYQIASARSEVVSAIAYHSGW